MEQKYCVYLHRRKDNNQVFYVGEGTIRRVKASCKYTRSKLWLATVEQAGGFTYEIVADNLNKQEAQNLENLLINQYPSLINSSTNRHPRDLSDEEIELLKSNFKYCPKSPSGLIRINGKIAGRKVTVNNKSYWKVLLNGTTYRVHRVIMVLMIGRLSKEDVVDHINGNGLDNTIENLRVCSQKENMQNVNTKNSENQGVKYCKRDDSWVAQWQENCKQKQKYFSVKKHGFEKARQLATEYRKLMVS